MNHKQISIILPVYNVTPYLRQALDSLLCQTHKASEIICVDDGSTDGSWGILEEYQQKETGFLLLSQENKGAGAARNLGLDRATGDYVLFLDPDDFFDPTLLETLYHKAEETQADVVICHALGYHHGTEKTYTIDPLFHTAPQGFFTYEDLVATPFSVAGVTPWNKLCRRDFLQKQQIRFQEIFRHNDVFFSISILVKGSRMVYLPQPLVYYRTGMKTNSQATLEKFPFAWYELMWKLGDLLEEYQVSATFYQYFLDWVLRMVAKAYTLPCGYTAMTLLDAQIRTQLEPRFRLSQATFPPYLQEEQRRYGQLLETPFDAYYYQGYWKEKQEKNQILSLYLQERTGLLCFFGSGYDGQFLLEEFRQKGWPLPDFFCDNAPSRQGTEVDGIPILSFAQAVETYGGFSVVIASRKYEKEIYQQVTAELPRERVLPLLF